MRRLQSYLHRRSAQAFARALIFAAGVATAISISPDGIIPPNR